MVPRKQAGHMTCTRPQAERQNLLAMRASSTHDPKPTQTEASFMDGQLGAGSLIAADHSGALTDSIGDD